MRKSIQLHYCRWLEGLVKRTILSQNGCLRTTFLDSDHYLTIAKHNEGKTWSLQYHQIDKLFTSRLSFSKNNEVLEYASKECGITSNRDYTSKFYNKTLRITTKVSWPEYFRVETKDVKRSTLSSSLTNVKATEFPMAMGDCKLPALVEVRHSWAKNFITIVG